MYCDDQPMGGAAAEEETRDLIEGVDEDGNNVLLEVVRYFFYNGEEYVVLGDAHESGCGCDCEHCHPEGDDEDEEAHRCEYVGDNGVQCRNMARPGSRFCGLHERMDGVEVSDDPDSLI